MTNLEQLTQKIITAVPSIETRYEVWSDEICGFVGMKDRIRLEDVLIALKETRPNDYGIFTVLPDGVIQEQTYYDSWNDITVWLLNTPLHLQSEETISEINKLIK